MGVTHDLLEGGHVGCLSSTERRGGLKKEERCSERQTPKMKRSLRYSESALGCVGRLVFGAGEGGRGGSVKGWMGSLTKKIGLATHCKQTLPQRCDSTSEVS